jgi:hypothetical protein
MSVWIARGVHGWAFFEDVTEFVKLCGSELRRLTAAEARTETFDTSFVPRACPPVRRGSGDPDAIACFLARIAVVEILHGTQSPDEIRLVRLLGLLNRDQVHLPIDASLTNHVNCSSSPYRDPLRARLRIPYYSSPDIA